MLFRSVTRIAFMFVCFPFFAHFLFIYIWFFFLTTRGSNILYAPGEDDGENDGKDKKHKRTLTQRYFSDENALFKRHKGKVSNKDLAELEHKVYISSSHHLS